VVAALKRRFPVLASPRVTDICYATQNRQEAAQWLAGVTDAVLVLGDQSSSNATRLREVAAARGVRALLAACVQDVPTAWFEGIDVLGLTSGASTPESLVQDAVAHFSAMGAAVHHELLGTEQVTFALPQVLGQTRIPEVTS
jgi:4-hydroxy-3-methylbut-2-enyl diphosphate reductase